MKLASADLSDELQDQTMNPEKTMTEMSPSPIDPLNTIERSVELVSPRQAKIYLASMARNRNISDPYVKQYARDMLAGAWREMGDPIRFNEQGQLIDGQHRLQAVIRSGKTIAFTILRNVPDEWMALIDTGRTRSISNVLQIQGVKNAALLAAATRWLHVAKLGLRDRTVIKLSTSEQLSMLERHPKLAQSAHKVYGSKGMTTSMLTAIHYIGAELLGHEERADAFARVFTHGMPFWRENDPALLWREKLLKERAEARKKMTPSMVWNGSVYVWNNFVKGHSLKIIKVPEKIMYFEGLDPGVI